MLLDSNVSVSQFEELWNRDVHSSASGTGDSPSTADGRREGALRSPKGETIETAVKI
jgi:hypothetical protein